VFLEENFQPNKMAFKKRFKKKIQGGGLRKATVVLGQFLPTVEVKKYFPKFSFEDGVTNIHDMDKNAIFARTFCILACRS